jgi:predicted Zn-dependent protease
MEVNFAGVENRYLSLQATVEGKDVRVLVSDKAIAAHMAKSGAPGSVLAAVQRVEQNRRRKSGTHFAVVLVLMGIAALLVVGAFAALRAAQERAVALVPPAWEVALGKTAAKSILSQKKICSHPEVVRAANEIGMRLVGALGAVPYSYKIRVLDDAEPNAFALPGGYVFLNRGLVEAAADLDEVAGVLAHELAHVQLRHGLSNIVRQAGIFIGLSVLIGDLGAVEQILLSNAASLLEMSFSREQETQADAEAVALMHRAKLNPLGLPRFLLTLSAKEGIAGALPSFLSTHPNSKQRSEDLNALAQALGPVQHRPLTASIESLRGLCDPLSVSDPDAP